MQQTRSKIPSKVFFVLALALLFGAGVGEWLTADRRPERAVTLSVVWGDGTQVAGGATVSWHTTSDGTTARYIKARPQPRVGADTGTESHIEVVLVRRGDKVILKGAPDNHRVPVGTTITIDGVPHAGGTEVWAVVP